MQRKLLLPPAVLAFSMSLLLVAYTFYFGWQVWNGPAAVSYFPWAWSHYYADGSAFHMFLISAGISMTTFAVSLVGLMRVTRNSVTVVKQDKLEKKETAQQVNNTTELPPGEDNESPNAWVRQEVKDPDTVDGILAEMNRSKQRKTILQAAIAREDEHFAGLLEKLNERMTAEGYPIVVPQGDARIENAKPMSTPQPQEQPDAKKLSWGEKRAAKKAEKEKKKEDEHRKRLDDKKRLVSLEGESKDEDEELDEQAYCSKTVTMASIARPRVDT